MGDPRNVVIVGGIDGQQSKLETSLEPVKLSQKMEIAVKTIFHGEIFNITNKNNTVRYWVTKVIENETGVETSLSGFKFEIPIGHYPTRFSILKAIADKFKQLDWPRRDDKTGYFLVDGVNFLDLPFFDVQWLKGDLITVKFDGVIIDLKGKDTPWRLLGISSPFDFIGNLKNVDFRSNLTPAFLYMNIVENSFINGNLSRLLTVIPLSMRDHWSYHQFSHPNYVPIEVNEFSKIQINILDLSGKVIEFNPEYETIISLHTRTINRPSMVDQA